MITITRNTAATLESVADLYGYGQERQKASLNASFDDDDVRVEVLDIIEALDGDRVLVRCGYFVDADGMEYDPTPEEIHAEIRVRDANEWRPSRSPSFLVIDPRN